VPFKREESLAADDTPSIDVVLDALKRCPGYDWVVLLQPTSPLRTAFDIDAAIERCIEANAPACVSVCEAEQSPYWMFTLGEEGLLHSILPSRIISRRQDLPPVYILNGAIYIARMEWLVKQHGFIAAETVAYKMPAQRSIDIDTELDFLWLQAIIGEHEHVSLFQTA
jgi:N-acylneuraminate cytidylyltransferase